MKKTAAILFTLIMLASQGNYASNNLPGGDDIIKLYIGSEYQKVIEIVKNKKPEELTPVEWYYLGLSYYQIKNIKESLNAFEQCVKKDSANAGYRLKNYEQAQFLCEQMLALVPGSAQSLFYLACSLDAMGKTSKALEVYKTAANLLLKEENYKTELKYVNEQIVQINKKIKERKFWEGKINE